MFCPACGHQNEDGIDYCLNCNALLPKMTPEQQLKARALHEAQQQVRSFHLSNQPASPLAIVVFVIVCLILGGLIYGRYGWWLLGSAAVPPVENNTQYNPDFLPATTPPPSTGNWVKVATLSGGGPKRSPVFSLGAGQKKLKYTVKGGEASILMVYVMPEGSRLMDDGGIPEIDANRAGSDATYLMQPPGRYYIDTMSCNCTWTVTIIEEK